jgi:hypothetical protein
MGITAKPFGKKKSIFVKMENSLLKEKEENKKKKNKAE